MPGEFQARIRNRADYQEFLRLDLEAHGRERWRWWLRFYKHELRFQRALRRAEYTRTFKGLGRALYWLARLQLARESQRTGISISPGSFGPGLAVGHHGSVVVNGKVRAGAFCRIQSSTNIGTFRDQEPVLGDFVYVGPGAVLFGGIKVGDRAQVGANAVVSIDVPHDSLAVGVPAVVKPLRAGGGAMPTRIRQRITADQQ